MARDGADGKTIRELSGLDATADRERFLVAYPDGLDGRWNTVLCCHDTDDTGFVRALVDHARRRWGADPDRVYATGASNCAAMSYRLAAALPGVFAAIAPVSGALADIDVREGFPPPRYRWSPSTAARTAWSRRWTRGWPPGAGMPGACHRWSRPTAAAAR